MSYILERTILYWCWWDLLALAILVGVCIYSYLKLRKMKETIENLEDRVAGKNAAEAVSAGETV